MVANKLLVRAYLETGDPAGRASGSTSTACSTTATPRSTSCAGGSAADGQPPQAERRPARRRTGRSGGCDPTARPPRAGGDIFDLGRPRRGPPRRWSDVFEFGSPRCAGSSAASGRAPLASAAAAVAAKPRLRQPTAVARAPRSWRRSRAGGRDSSRASPPATAGERYLAALAAEGMFLFALTPADPVGSAPGLVVPPVVALEPSPDLLPRRSCRRAPEPAPPPELRAAGGLRARAARWRMPPAAEELRLPSRRRARASSRTTGAGASSPSRSLRPSRAAHRHAGRALPPPGSPAARRSGSSARCSSASRTTLGPRRARAARTPRAAAGNTVALDARRAARGLSGPSRDGRTKVRARSSC